MFERKKSPQPPFSCKGGGNHEDSPRPPFYKGGVAHADSPQTPFDNGGKPQAGSPQFPYHYVGKIHAGSTRPLFCAGSTQPLFYNGGKAHEKASRSTLGLRAGKNAALIMFLLIPMVLLIPSFLEAGERKPKGTFALFIENDVFALEDGGYTNGVDLVWLSPELGAGRGRAPRWADGLSRSLARAFKPGARRFVSFSLAQRMYTPEDITRSDLVRDDRPYAGVLTAGLGFHFRHGNAMDSLRFEAGIVGPHSYAGDIQNLLHKAFRWTYPKGWAHQLHDELVLGLEFDRRQRLRASSGAAGLDWELIGHSGGSLSNLFTAFGGGLEVRAGWNLPWDLGTSLLGPASDAAVLLVDPEPLPPRPDRLGFHIFMAVEARVVARDLLLDGNTFRDSHRVSKEPLTADLAAGLALKYKRLKACLSYTYQTRRFAGQHLRPFFGSLDLALLF